jgi:cytidylate kinase
MPVITVSRQYGSMGDEIAQAVAEKLGLRLVAQDVLSEVARRLGVTQSQLSERDERDSNLVANLVRTMRRLYPATVPPSRPDEGLEVDEAAYLQVTRQVIWEIARNRDAIIVDRGAAFILESNPDVLHVLLVAPLSHRIEMVMATEKLEQRQALQKIKSADSSRSKYIRHYYRAKWLDAGHYDLVLNTAHFSQRAATSLICSAVAADRDKPTPKS